MEMHQVRYFVSLCETLNFTKAAEACNVAQPSLTKAIQKLEDELGGPLFCRERGLTHLTSLGKIMKPHLQAVHTSSEIARAEANSFIHQGKATLQLGMLQSVSPLRFVNFFHGFHAHAPSIAFNISTDTNCSLISELLAGEIEAAIMSDHNLPERCDAIPLFEEDYVLAAPHSHPLAINKTVKISDLKTFSLLPHGLDFPCLAHIPVKNFALCDDKADWIQSLTLAGFGIAILPASVPLLNDIVTIPFDDSSLKRKISLVTVAGRRHTPALRSLRTFATQHDWSLHRAKLAETA